MSLHNVDYAYANGRQVFDDLNLNLPAGSVVAVTGPDGAGKSTLIDLLTGLRRPSAGYVAIDGIDLRELRPDSLREHLAVARGPEIFSGTIAENVHLNRPGMTATCVREALESVGLLRDLLKLPEGLNTRLSTGGAPLSHGQSLRLALARALVGRPRLLLIDGTLDALSDADLHAVLDRLTLSPMPWTLLIATGRSELLRRCRHVIALPQGVASRPTVEMPSGHTEHSS